MNDVKKEEVAKRPLPPRKPIPQDEEYFLWELTLREWQDRSKFINAEIVP